MHANVLYLKRNKLYHPRSVYTLFQPLNHKTKQKTNGKLLWQNTEV